MVDYHMAAVAHMVRENAIHGWRTLDEIAKDEGLRVAEVERACEMVLTEDDMRWIRLFRGGLPQCST